MYQTSPPSPSRQNRQRRQRRWSPVGRLATATALAGVLAVSGAVPAAAGNSTIHLSHRPLTVIPDAALLQPEDLGGTVLTSTVLTPTDGDYWTSLQPPQPCAESPYPSTALRRAERGVQALIGVDGGPETSSGAEAIVRQFIPAAVRRAAVLNR